MSKFFLLKILSFVLGYHQFKLRVEVLLVLVVELLAGGAFMRVGVETSVGQDGERVFCFCYGGPGLGGQFGGGGQVGHGEDYQT